MPSITLVWMEILLAWVMSCKLLPKMASKDVPLVVRYLLVKLCIIMLIKSCQIFVFVCLKSVSHQQYT